MRFEANIDIFLKKAIKSRLLKDKKKSAQKTSSIGLEKFFDYQVIPKDTV